MEKFANLQTSKTQLKKTLLAPVTMATCFILLVELSKKARMTNNIKLL